MTPPQTVRVGDVTVTIDGADLRDIRWQGHEAIRRIYPVFQDRNWTNRLFTIGDIELTGFGPYYGDAWSDLSDFELSIERLRHVNAEWWLTFHHKGLIESREKFLAMLDSFAAMIGKREIGRAHV